MSFRIRKATVRHKKKKSKEAQETLDRLNEFLNAKEPSLVRLLTQFWKDQQGAITYKELREAILSGRLDERTLADWQQDYINLVNNKLEPAWANAMETGAAKIIEVHPKMFIDPMNEGIKSWISIHGAEWVASVSDDQRKAIASMIDRAISGEWTVDELARAIRPTIGLTMRQSQANLNYYQKVKNHLMDKNPTIKEDTANKKAREAAAKYAERQHRKRAYDIATTELAFAYNKGADYAVKQAMEQGYMGKTRRVWSTAYDDGVCPICSALEGVETDMDGEFNFKGKSLYSGQKQTPPAHPRCRCGIEYKEID